MAEKPLDLIHGSLEKNVLVELRGNRVFRGILKGYDQHLNLVMADTEELADDEVFRKIGYIVIRGANVVYLAPRSL
ncbi:MAG: small nuclear ribonucleoprotein [Theionarchaea archaeon]|nr:small nuclear ribonucleoprotein [Theionarchaea archaeon]MBU6999722.1 small nuclear ribonucleoprotein [Theionarchaea archaeon]MBU7020698.1 small nuclear ribonucleoprotein [Theionarchaea archaeon]MBU7034664.1 small nuclear ribonucleoprotein [Theionarchaea archaeon]MBU7039873.1 small nuclear ribonucleoprotein [Theionarchaea archaeon]